MKRLIRLSLLMIFFYQPLMAQQPKAFTGGKINPISGKTIENGVLVTQDSKILAVGATGKVDIPSNAKEYDVSGKVAKNKFNSIH